MSFSKLSSEMWMVVSAGASDGVYHRLSAGSVPANGPQITKSELDRVSELR